MRYFTNEISIYIEIYITNFKHKTKKSHSKLKFKAATIQRECVSRVQNLNRIGRVQYK